MTQNTAHAALFTEQRFLHSDQRPMSRKVHVGITDVLTRAPTNFVQSMRANTVADLRKAAEDCDQSFMHATIRSPSTPMETLEKIAADFSFKLAKLRYADLLLALTEPPANLHCRVGGFVIVLEGLPWWGVGAAEAREELLDVFRDAAEIWANRSVPYRCYYALDVSAGRSRVDRHLSTTTLTNWLTR